MLEGGGSLIQWWFWKGKWKEVDWGDYLVENQKFICDVLCQMVEDEVLVVQCVFDENYLCLLFIQFYKCKNVFIEGVIIKNLLFWLVNLVLCENVMVIGVYCDSYGLNFDGCDLESCKDVFIENCVFDIGDDCIVIKLGCNVDGCRVGVLCENILINVC